MESNIKAEPEPNLDGVSPFLTSFTLAASTMSPFQLWLVYPQRHRIKFKLCQPLDSSQGSRLGQNLLSDKRQPQAAPEPCCHRPRSQVQTTLIFVIVCQVILSHLVSSDCVRLICCSSKGFSKWSLGSLSGSHRGSLWGLRSALGIFESRCWSNAKPCSLVKLKTCSSKDVFDGIFEPRWCNLAQGNCALALTTFSSK